MMSKDEPLAKMASATIHYFLGVRARLPFLRAVVAEGGRIAAEGLPLKNDILLRLFSDSYDMLVIDLCSLRERVAKKGLFTRLHQHLDRLRRFRPTDFNPQPMLLGDEWTSDLAHDFVAGEAKFMSDDCNKYFDWLFPGGDPVTPEHVRALTKRFLEDTKPTFLDRNKARAHRYEEKPAAAAQHFQTLEQVQQQVEVFERYLHAICLVLTGGSFAMDSPGFRWDVEATAQDLADLIVIGSINEAVVRYGVVTDEKDMTFRYWFRRKKFLDEGRKITE
jgi:hypothetical protein